MNTTQLLQEEQSQQRGRHFEKCGTGDDALIEDIS